jgi:hypothetical protein
MLGGRQPYFFLEKKVPLKQSTAWHMIIILLHTGGMDVLIRGDVILMDLKMCESRICFSV